jgi:serine/threonine protein kinase/Flp pilus assembly protein TadD
MNQGMHDEVQVSADGIGASASMWAGSQSFETVEKKELIDQAYDEYCRRREAGERPDPDVFCDGFPYQSSLRRLLEVDRLVQEHPSLLVKEAPKDWPAPGDRFLGFVILRELGRGAFARVYLATEPALGNRRVAVKIALHGAAEAETLGRLQHRNIVSVHSVQKDAETGMTAVCMPYLGGSNLCHLLDRVTSDRLGQTRFPATAEVVQLAIDETRSPDEPPLPKRWTHKESYVDAVAEIGEQLAEGLASIHAQGICHRDLKPSNVLLAADGRAMLLDFNLSFDAQASEQRLGGTLPYMSPEHLRATDPHLAADPAAVDARSDLFSLGVLLYELLTGTHPFGAVPLKWSAEQVREHLRRKHQEGPRPMRLANPRVNKALARLIECCLAADPADRPQSAGELSAALRRTRPLWSRTRRWAAGHARFLAAASILVLAAGTVGALGAYSLPAKGTSDPQDLAKQGREFYRLGKYDKAVEAFDRALETDNDNADFFFARGRAYQQMGKTDAAMRSYEAADTRYLDAGDPDARHGLVCASRAYCLNLSEHPKQAIELYKQAINAHFDNALIHNNLGYSYSVTRDANNSDESKAAVRELTIALQMDGNLQAAYHNRALLHATDAANFSRFDSTSPQADMDRAANLPPKSGRICWDAAHLFLLASLTYESQVQAGYSTYVEQSGSLGIANFVAQSVYLAWITNEANFHRAEAAKYLQQALELGQPRNAARADPILRSLLKEIGEVNLHPVPERDLRLLDPVRD